MQLIFGLGQLPCKLRPASSKITKLGVTLRRNISHWDKVGFEQLCQQRRIQFVGLGPTGNDGFKARRMGQDYIALLLFQLTGLRKIIKIDDIFFYLAKWSVFYETAIFNPYYLGDYPPCPFCLLFKLRLTRDRKLLCR